MSSVQLNLIPPHLRRLESALNFSLLRLIAIILLAFFVLLSAGLWAYQKNLQKRFNALDSNLKQLESKQEEIKTKTLAAAKGGKKPFSDQIAAIQSQIASKKALATLMGASSKEKADNAGVSSILKTISEGNILGVQITKIEYNKVTRNIVIDGLAKNAQIINEWLDNVKQKKQLSDYSFNNLALERIASDNAKNAKLDAILFRLEGGEANNVNR